MKSILVGLVTVTGAAWLLFAIGRLAYQGQPEIFHAAGDHFTKPVWYWWDWIAIAPLLAIGVGLILVILWGIGEKLAGE
ncbi:hypothetical protein F1C58_16125 (plasmid) [Glaciihabitans sp. INWT7]|uniref:hypothetical protein n=1 Tax=Glaciihabitans sp. INWT7 TaxID=2596912 RepID=UPI00162437D2|nr:hypothetical protein [Glaciihabitans sp. INWT7]QNE48588.1 hypothetical protein F1C58_16125 [Glaciihabitans sp. INWT7]